MCKLEFQDFTAANFDATSILKFWRRRDKKYSNGVTCLMWQGILKSISIIFSGKHSNCVAMFLFFTINFHVNYKSYVFHNIA